MKCNNFISSKILIAWWQFIKERFPIFFYLPMVAMLWFANFAVSRELAKDGVDSFAYLSLFLVISFFLRIRILDDIRDFSDDKKDYPQRPLSRKLLTISQAWHGVFLLYIFEGLCALLCGWATFMVWLVAAAYTLLMVKDFFCGSTLQRNWHIYAICNTIIAFWISLVITSAVLDVGFAEIAGASWLFAIANWFIFTIFTFAYRFASKEKNHHNISTKNQQLLLLVICAEFAIFTLFIIKLQSDLSLPGVWLLVVSNGLIIPLFWASYYKKIAWSTKILKKVMMIFPALIYLAIIYTASQG